MLAIVTGLKAANSIFSCIWCVFNKDFNAQNIFSLFRSIPDCQNENKGRKNESLVHWNIPITTVLIDTLHLLLRILIKYWKSAKI